MRITKRRIQEEPETVEVSAEVDSYRLWYRMPRAYRFSRSGDPFLAAALLPAMFRGEVLEIDADMPVSPRILRNLPHVQEIYHSWNPALKIIAIHAVARPAEPLNEEAIGFFSGGIDSTYTLLKHERVISHAVFIQGFDFYTYPGGPYRSPSMISAICRNSPTS